MNAMQDNGFFDEPGDALVPASVPQPAAVLTQTDLPLPPPLPPDLPDQESLNRPRPIAPAWHTLVLVLGILAFSIWGAMKKDSSLLAPVHAGAAVQSSTASESHGVNTVRLIRYGLTGILELSIVAWVAFGLRLRKIPFRSLFGAWPRGLNNITKEAGIAALFWICSMFVLAVLALTWAGVEMQIDKHQKAAEASHAAPSQSPNQGESKKESKPRTPKKSPDEKQADLIRELTELAPANGIEVAGWGLLCLIVGFSEELVFRGYLQTQSIALLRKLPIGMLFTAVVFGAAHGYQGVRGMVLISVYGLLFGCIVLLRRSLFPGMLAHSWHDFFTGMMLALIRASGLLDRLHLSH